MCKYTICADNFKPESYIQQHKECVHESNAPYTCELCHTGFDGDNNLNRYIESNMALDLVIWTFFKWIMAVFEKSICRQTEHFADFSCFIGNYTKN